MKYRARHCARKSCGKLFSTNIGARYCCPDCKYQGSINDYRSGGMVETTDESGWDEIGQGSHVRKVFRDSAEDVGAWTDKQEVDGNE